MPKITIGTPHRKTAKRTGPRIRLGTPAGTPASTPAATPKAAPVQKFAPDIQALFDRCRLLHSENKLAEVEPLYRQLLQRAPNHADGLHLFGVLHFQLGKREAAIPLIQKAVGLNPNDPGMQNNLGNALRDAGRCQEAIAHYDQATALKPDYGEAYSNKGTAYRALNRTRAAAECFAEAIKVTPDNPQPYFNLANIYLAVKRFQDAYTCFRKAFSLDPKMEMALGNLLLVKQQLCDWRNWDEDFAALIDGIDAGEMVCAPFTTLTLPISGLRRHKVATNYAQKAFPPPKMPAWNGERYEHDIIRVGYLSADFRAHAVSHLTAEIYERHDRSKFEIYGFSLTASGGSDIRNRLDSAFDHIHELQEKSDDEVTALIRELEIDILVDLGGYTDGSRTRILANRPAPVQINFLGYPGTMGADFIDYIIGDATLIPPAHLATYAEKVIAMPDCYQPTDTKKKISETATTRADWGLSEGAFIFCAFNNTFKLTPDVFAIWMRILLAVENSQQWLVEITDGIQENLSKEARKLGVAPERLVFAKHAPYPDHLERHRHADLFLDSFHYNAGTMASEALWMGLPVLTRTGDSFSNRMATSLLTCLDMPELITATSDEYEKRAIEFATKPGEIAAVAKKLRENIKSRPLFDMKRYTRNLDAAFLQVAERTRKGLPPDHIGIEPLPPSATQETPVALEVRPTATLFREATELHRQGRTEAAAETYRAVLKADPDHVQALHSLGLICTESDQPGEAEKHLRKAAQLAPEDYAVQTNYGNFLRGSGRRDEALTHLQKAAVLAPDDFRVLTNLGNTFKDMSRLEEAVAYYDKAIAIEPNDARIHFNKGGVLRNLKRYRDSVDAFAKAIALDDTIEQLVGSWLLSMQAACDWRDWEKAKTLLIEGIKAGRIVTAPFAPLATAVPASLRKRAAEQFSAKFLPVAKDPLWKGDIYSHDRIRVGYLSYDLRDHAVANLTAELYERHDRKDFEIFGLSLSPPEKSPVRDRLKKGFDEFHELGAKSNLEIAQFIRKLEIDILVDIGGHTRGARTAVLTHRPAPVHISYLGYPGTMGVPYMDYIVGDATLIPPDHRKFYSEKVIYLPDCYQPTDTRKKVSKKKVTRTDYGLDENAFVFCSFNTNFKITPDLFDAWMRILKRTDGSQLWMVDKGGELHETLLSEAEARGVSPDRIIFTDIVPYADHLARHACADLHLDAFHYNAGTVASDALWMGLPVLTCPGDSYSNRMAASLLAAIDLPELIADSHEDYENRAVDFAANPAKLAAVRGKLLANRTTRPLFNMERYTRHLESAYRQIVDRTREALLPDHIQVAPIED